VEVLARRACMSQDHFSKAFKSIFGIPPREFVENLRLNEAQRRLTKRQKTIQSVATSVGYANTGAFQRAFERRFGKRPGRLLQETRALRVSPKNELAAPVAL
ncbi:MAG TPA: helix-turn-helix transcriptional regulator, partial [Chthoniobacterales bacterium]